VSFSTLFQFSILINKFKLFNLSNIVWIRFWHMYQYNGDMWHPNPNLIFKKISKWNEIWTKFDVESWVDKILPRAPQRWWHVAVWTLFHYSLLLIKMQFKISFDTCLINNVQGKATWQLCICLCRANLVR